MTNDDIKAIALANGFTLREQPDGSMDLNPYVYGFARAMFGAGFMASRPSVTKDEIDRKLATMYASMQGAGISHVQRDDLTGDER